MQNSNQGRNLQIELDTENFELSPGEINKLERGLDPLRKPVRNFPVARLYITVTYHAGSREYRIKTSLVLPGRTIATGDLDEAMYSGFERCVRKLVKRVEAYKAAMENQPEVSKHHKGTRQEILPTQDIDARQLLEAIDAGDYAAFRQVMYAYEEPVRKRVGRWIARRPDAAEQLGGEFAIDDIVEEVFLNAFEYYPHRPSDVRLGDWLESLIDPSIKLIQQSPDDELENIRFVRTFSESQNSR